MNAAVIVATGLSFAAAVVSGFFALMTARQSEKLRQENAAAARLRDATGAMRLQMFLGTRSVVRRLDLYYNGQPTHPYELGADRPGSYKHHHAGLLIYRLLRPLALSHIIEHETYYGDLLIEPTMADLLRFNQAAYEMLTGYEIGRDLDSVEAERRRWPAPLKRGSRTPSRRSEWEFFGGFSPDLCWDQDARTPSTESGPFQRVRSTYLRRAAAALVVTKPSASGQLQKRCMTHAEFCELWEKPESLRGAEDTAFHEALDPVTRVIHEFYPATNPVFWLRLVGYAYVCAWFHTRVREAPFAREETWFGRWRRRHRFTSRGITYTPLVLPTAEMLSVVEKLKEVKADAESSSPGESTDSRKQSPFSQMRNLKQVRSSRLFNRTVALRQRRHPGCHSFCHRPRLLKAPGNTITGNDVVRVPDARDYVKTNAHRYEERFKEIIQRAL